MNEKEELKQLIKESEGKDGGFFESGLNSLKDLKRARFMVPVISLLGFLSIFLDKKNQGIEEIPGEIMGVTIGICGLIFSIYIWRKYPRLKKEKEDRDKRIEELIGKLK